MLVTLWLVNTIPSGYSLSWGSGGDYEGGTSRLILTDSRGVNFIQDCYDVSTPDLTYQAPSSQYQLMYFSPNASSYGAKALCYYMYGAGIADANSLYALLSVQSNAVAASVNSMSTFYTAQAPEAQLATGFTAGGEFNWSSLVTSPCCGNGSDGSAGSSISTCTASQVLASVYLTDLKQVGAVPVYTPCDLNWEDQRNFACKVPISDSSQSSGTVLVYSGLSDYFGAQRQCVTAGGSMLLYSLNATVPGTMDSRFYWVQQVGYNCRIGFVNQSVMGATMSADCTESFPFMCSVPMKPPPPSPPSPPSPKPAPPHPPLPRPPPPPRPLPPQPPPPHPSSPSPHPPSPLFPHAPPDHPDLPSIPPPSPPSPPAPSIPDHPLPMVLLTPPPPNPQLTPPPPEVPTPTPSSPYPPLSAPSSGVPSALPPGQRDSAPLPPTHLLPLPPDPTPSPHLTQNSPAIPTEAGPSRYPPQPTATTATPPDNTNLSYPSPELTPASPHVLSSGNAGSFPTTNSNYLPPPSKNNSSNTDMPPSPTSSIPTSHPPVPETSSGTLGAAEAPAGALAPPAAQLQQASSSSSSSYRGWIAAAVILPIAAVAAAIAVFVVMAKRKKEAARQATYGDIAAAWPVAARIPLASPRSQGGSSSSASWPSDAIRLPPGPATAPMATAQHDQPEAAASPLRSEGSTTRIPLWQKLDPVAAAAAAMWTRATGSLKRNKAATASPDDSGSNTAAGGEVDTSSTAAAMATNNSSLDNGQQTSSVTNWNPVFMQFLTQASLGGGKRFSGGGSSDSSVLPSEVVPQNTSATHDCHLSTVIGAESSSAEDHQELEGQQQQAGFCNYQAGSIHQGEVGTPSSSIGCVAVDMMGRQDAYFHNVRKEASLMLSDAAHKTATSELPASMESTESSAVQMRDHEGISQSLNDRKTVTMGAQVHFPPEVFTGWAMAAAETASAVNWRAVRSSSAHSAAYCEDSRIPDSSDPRLDPLVVPTFPPSASSHYGLAFSEGGSGLVPELEHTLGPPPSSSHEQHPLNVHQNVILSQQRQDMQSNVSGRPTSSGSMPVEHQAVQQGGTWGGASCSSGKDSEISVRSFLLQPTATLPAMLLDNVNDVTSQAGSSGGGGPSLMATDGSTAGGTDVAMEGSTAGGTDVAMEGSSVDLTTCLNMDSALHSDGGGDMGAISAARLRRISNSYSNDVKVSSFNETHDPLQYDDEAKNEDFAEGLFHFTHPPIKAVTSSSSNCIRHPLSGQQLTSSHHSSDDYRKDDGPGTCLQEGETTSPSNIRAPAASTIPNGFTVYNNEEAAASQLPLALHGKQAGQGFVVYDNPEAMRSSLRDNMLSRHRITADEDSDQQMEPAVHLISSTSTGTCSSEHNRHAMPTESEAATPRPAAADPVAESSTPKRRASLLGTFASAAGAAAAAIAPTLLRTSSSLLSRVFHPSDSGSIHDRPLIPVSPLTSALHHNATLYTPFQPAVTTTCVQSPIMSSELQLSSSNVNEVSHYMRTKPSTDSSPTSASFPFASATHDYGNMTVAGGHALSVKAAHGKVTALKTFNQHVMTANTIFGDLKPPSDIIMNQQQDAISDAIISAGYHRHDDGVDSVPAIILAGPIVTAAASPPALIILQEEVCTSRAAQYIIPPAAGGEEEAVAASSTAASHDSQTVSGDAPTTDAQTDTPTDVQTDTPTDAQTDTPTDAQTDTPADDAPTEVASAPSVHFATAVEEGQDNSIYNIDEGLVAKSSEHLAASASSSSQAGLTASASSSSQDPAVSSTVQPSIISEPYDDVNRHMAGGLPLAIMAALSTSKEPSASSPYLSVQTGTTTTAAAFYNMR
ncbi:hypothetical protein CEUSTIGMA_g4813.t1 [Chlamydomonas eustigma]|uniref:C-type lectin domain-containing protein n=1 Tax=Chlamydomonas eustigma TaxID=1157962 RepID=A0A250X2R9_9CHLO|nr:hypothetical protein CEUSTIGMA_g4813.t1 [Chlamydomonas eustigma]|eukprot:GAX77367.1 hypothetical protein CEUSTIGMA_g4813.t1 [Chlamydomonas eustigma]